MNEESAGINRHGIGNERVLVKLETEIDVIRERLG
jgi:hypothetical protein